MDQFTGPLPAEENNEHTEVTQVVYPPKYTKDEADSNVWIKSLISLGLYLVLGYYIFHSFKMLLLITAIVVIHEMGHFLAMKFYRYNDLGIFFIPLLGAYVSGTKREVSQKESAVILLAGPLPGIIIGIILHLLYLNDPYMTIAGISVERISVLFIILNLLNLIPVYPLDGGQLLNRVFLDEESWISKVFVFLSAAFMCWLAWKLRFPVLLIFPLMMLLRLQTDSKFNKVEQRIEDEKINIDVSYKDLPDEDYWKIRNILIEEHPSYKEIAKTPPYEYHNKEEKIMAAIESLLHRHLIQDMSVITKIFIILLWLAAFAAPWLMDMDLSFFRNLGL